MNITLFRSAHRVPGRSLVVASGAAASVLIGAGSAFAQNDMAALFALVDISGAQALVFTVFGGLVAIGLLFFGRRVLRRVGVSM
jgi:hypothetical protein